MAKRLIKQRLSVPSNIVMKKETLPSQGTATDRLKSHIDSIAR